MKKKFLKIAAFATAGIIASSVFAVGAPLITESAYAMTDSTMAANTAVLNAKTPEQIESALKEAGNLATADNPYIVYVPKGTYKMTKKLTVPTNVTLVAEKQTVFEPTTETNFTQFFMVYGNVYGGTYSGKNMAYYCLRFADVKFEGKNGTIERTNVSNSKRAGIVAIGSNTRYAYVYNNNVTGCGNSGISAVSGAWMAVVSGNKCRNNKSSGINIGHANINTISNNVLTGNTGHGISTDIDGSGGHKYCHIHKIRNNTITDNGLNGVYIDKKCYVDVIFSKNVIKNNGLNGLSIDADAYVNVMTKNTITGNKASNINVTGAKAVANIGNSNTISEAKTNNISINSGGSVSIYGKNNTVSNSTNHGISVNNGASLSITGKSNAIKDNSKFGIRVAGNSTADIINTTFSNNGGWAVKVEKGSSMKYDATSNISEDKTAPNRIYIEK